MCISSILSSAVVKPQSQKLNKVEFYHLSNDPILSKTTHATSSYQETCFSQIRQCFPGPQSKAEYIKCDLMSDPKFEVHMMITQPPEETAAQLLLVSFCRQVFSPSQTWIFHVWLVNQDQDCVKVYLYTVRCSGLSGTE